MQQLLTQKTLLKILVIDDHESVLSGTVAVLQKHYVDAEIITVVNAFLALEQISILQPDVVIMDLSLPKNVGTTAKPEIGVQLLRTLMKNYPELNIVVQSAHIRTLVRIKPEIDSHKGGFTVADKSLTTQEMLTRVDWALQGLTHTKDIKGIHTGLEIKPEWLQVLSLAFDEGLQDKAIAQKMSISERMVRHYWSKLQDALELYPDQGKNIRIQTEMRARDEGLID
ncbi:response regulator [Nostoc sp. CMAA1605]|uniref:response regulator n=1 Tax=Nostoc sp. CMAA1605 TaxID=2055159 RepID=UPI001F40CE8E|nr:response regulator transcription factor [Nostoc sp. CMAA1605]MCF4968067.1 response regulator [Nostoc sp. CMAA1605]